MVEELRKSLKLGQAQVAALLTVDLRTLRNWEQGRREPPCKLTSYFSRFLSTRQCLPASSSSRLNRAPSAP